MASFKEQRSFSLSFVFLCLAFSLYTPHFCSSRPLSIDTMNNGAGAGRVQLEKETVPLFNGWKELQKSPAEELVTIRFNLLHKNLDKLEKTFFTLSDPLSPSYRAWLTKDQLRDLISPEEKEVSRVELWLQAEASKGGGRGRGRILSEVRRAQLGDYLFATLSVGLAEDLFGVQLFQFSHPLSSRRIVRANSPYSVPSFLASIVRSVSNLSNFPPLRKKKSSRSKGQILKEEGSSASNGNGDGDPGQSVTPELLRSKYQVNVNGTANKKNGQALAEFEQDYFYPSDLNLFQQKYNLPVQNVSYIIGINDPNTGVLGEASLDVQYIMAVSTNTITWVWSLDAFDLVQWAINVTETPNSPPVHSISYGSGEADFENNTLTQVNIEFQKLGTLGYSIFVASGDEGTGHTGFFGCGKFNPDFPGSSPYITSVGGTYLNQGETQEVGVGFSGGGFSNLFPQPSYQSAAVKNYLASTKDLPDQRYYTPTGRGIPDVSALATNYMVMIEGGVGPVSGTSAACPVFAGLIALINGQLISQNKPVLGFVNPLLYHLGKVGFDVTTGNNKNSRCPAGFPASPGWDAVTGLGTPLFPYLSQQILNSIDNKIKLNE